MPHFSLTMFIVVIGPLPLGYSSAVEVAVVNGRKIVKRFPKISRLGDHYENGKHNTGQKSVKRCPGEVPFGLKKSRAIPSSHRDIPGGGRRGPAAPSCGRGPSRRTVRHRWSPRQAPMPAILATLWSHCKHGHNRRLLPAPLPLLPQPPLALHLERCIGPAPLRWQRATALYPYDNKL